MSVRMRGYRLNRPARARDIIRCAQERPRKGMPCRACTFARLAARLNNTELFPDDSATFA